ncbi:hypothetical protein RDMS_10225 [Deinococcus sp. RL]|uniref:hypothetical protein n=1 Tax=Deinococcus sp. RL TaxID=1489678 RepID=UPI0004D4E2B7|nr:hypothetical protein [Deinococcus sp. RL]KEF33832.1 hypothetical protein RDMS_10225 [Deinococcus sp. RL]
MFGFLRRSPAGHPLVRQDDPGTFRVRVRTHRHGEVVEVRLTKAAHIGADDGGGYVFRKAVVSPQHFDRGELVVRFDGHYRVIGTEAEGLDFIPVAEWKD